MTSIPQQIGNYVLEGEIGHGSSSEVWLGRHKYLKQRQVAIKVLMAQDRESVLRFSREANIATRLQHPHIVQLYDHGHYPPFFCTMLEYIHGASLAQLLEREKRLSPDDALRIFKHIALALDYAHSLDVIHRDVSPGNIMIEQATGRALLTDFGIAREPNTSLTTTRSIMGTPGFWSPEHVRSATEVTHLSDIYSMGVVLYLMLSGELPWEEPPSTPQFTFTPPVPLKERGVERLPKDVDRIIQTLLAIDPAKRYPTAQAALAELERVFMRHQRVTEVVSHGGVAQDVDGPATLYSPQGYTYEADGVQANEVEMALGPDLVRAHITEAHQRAELLRQPGTLTRLLDEWSSQGRLRRPLLGRMAQLHKVSSRNIYFYELRVMYETRHEPELVEEPDEHATIYDLEPELDRWKVALPPAQDWSAQGRGELVLQGSTRVTECAVCAGKGKTICPECKGRQRVVVTKAVEKVPVSRAVADAGAMASDAGPAQALVPCPTCEGRGGLRCNHCAGIGRLVQRKLLHWQRDLRTLQDNDQLPAQHEQWLLRTCQTHEIYRERATNGVRAEWQLVPALAEMVEEAQAAMNEDTRIVLSEATVSFIPISDIVFDLGAADKGDEGLYRLSIYGFENGIPADWRFLNWDRIILYVGGGFLLLLTLVFAFFAFAH